MISVAIRAALERAALGAQHLDALERHVRSLLPEGADAGSLHLADLAIAFCAARGDAVALERFDEALLKAADATLSRRGIDPDTSSEVKQRLRERMLVPQAGGGSPKALEYGGRGSLENWLRICAIREAMHLVKRAKESPVESLELLVSADKSPDSAVLRERFAGHITAALAQVTATLSHEDRTLLRQHFIDGLTMEELGSLLGVHKATVSRRIQKIRDEILSGVRRDLGRLGLGRAEFDSLFREVRSAIDIRLTQTLREPD